jgi:hypothetical protein
MRIISNRTQKKQPFFGLLYMAIGCDFMRG